MKRLNVQNSGVLYPHRTAAELTKLSVNEGPQREASSVTGFRNLRAKMPAARILRRCPRRGDCSQGKFFLAWSCPGISATVLSVIPLPDPGAREWREMLLPSSERATPSPQVGLCFLTVS